MAQLEVALECVKQYDAEIASLTPQHPDYALFDPLPGAGPVHAPRLMVAFGEQRERFSNAAEVQKYSGVAPVTQRSGQSTGIHRRWKTRTPYDESRYLRALKERGSRLLKMAEVF